MKTYVPRQNEIDRTWWIVDASERPLGRMATHIASVLRGKHKPQFTPFLDTGDHVIVVNARQVKLTGNKADQKTYFRHSGYMGGEQHIPFKRMLERHPERIIELAVRGMLPKNKLGRELRKKLRVYPDAEHPHAGQNPKTLEI